MSTPLTSAIARIYDFDTKVVGAGFLISKTHVVTCAHVVAQALNISDETPDPPTENLKLDFPLVASGVKVSAKVVHWRPVTPVSSMTGRADDEDIAVLEITDTSNLQGKPTRMRVADDVWNHDFRAFGFPALHDEGTWTEGRLKARQANNWIQVEGKNHVGYFVAPGYSGTAVWDEQLAAVVGMVVVSDKRPETRAAFIIPTSTLIKVWPELSRSVESADAPKPYAESEPTTVGPVTATDFWNDVAPEYKAFHQADRSSKAYRPDILLVTVSSGGVNATWDEFPAEVLSKTNIDIDVLSIEYPAEKLTSTVVRRLAGKLRLLLSSTFPAYRHFVFVVKDADVVVRQMLIEDVGKMLGSTTLRLLYELRLTSRTRNIISISTGSRGDRGRLAKTIGDAFKTHLVDYEAVGLPTPQSLELVSTVFQDENGDGSREDTQPNGGNGLRARLPRPLVASVAERLGPFRSARTAALARLTIFRSIAVDPQVRTLFGIQEPSPEETSITDAGSSQTELLDQLTDLANSAGPETLRVVTGGAGTGKSVLLRRVARRLAVKSLSGPHAALPIFIPLYQFKIDASDPNPARLWQLLNKELATWANELLDSNATEEERKRPELITIDADWINDHLRRLPTTLILDGVDEFLLYNPGLSVTDFAALLRFLRTEFNSNLQFLLIAGIRSSPRDTSLITDSESEVLTLRGMTPSEATAIFPSAMRLIGPASDAVVQRLLLTPLVLSALDKSKLMLKPEAYLNRAALISAALTADIESLKRTWRGRPYSTNDWINALSLLAWSQFRELRGEISEKFIATSAAVAVNAWSAAPNNEAAADAIKSFQILLDSQSRSALLRKTVFIPVRENSYRLRHKEWGDYLVAHYAVLCIRYGHFDDLAARALNHDIYILAGQQFEESETDRSTVHALVERAKSQDRFLIVGNFAQMLGATFAPIAGDVLYDEILTKLSLFPIVVKFAMLSALSARMLAHDERDQWHELLSPVIMKTLHQHAQDENENSLVRSLCWCFLKAMTNTDATWSGLWNNEKQELDTLSVIATPSEHGFAVNDRQRSIQAAFMRIQSYALEIPNRVISTVHYLYPLVLALSRQVPLDRTVMAELPLLLADPNIDEVYRNHRVSEVAAIWNRCKELYNETVARSPRGKNQ